MVSAATGLERRYDLHGIGVEVRAGGPAVLEAVDTRLRAFPPVDGTIEVTIEFARSADLALAAVEGHRPVYDTRHGSLYYDPGRDVLGGRFGGVTLTCHASQGEARLSAAEFTGADLYIATHPLLTVSLMELLERRGLFSLHAACLAEPEGRGILICGTSGAGKSTLALALAHAGMGFLADDVVFLADDDPAGGVKVLGFSDALGVSELARERFPPTGAAGAPPPPPGFPKRLWRIEDLTGAAPLTVCRPDVLVFPEVTGAPRSQIEPLDAGEALLRLVPDVLITHPHSTQEHLRRIAALLSQVRCFTLATGRDIERAAKMVRALQTR